MNHTPEQVERVARALWNKRIPFETWVEAQEAALAALTAAGQGWRLMKEAPKGGGADDTRDPAWVKPPKILLQFGAEAVSVAYWDWYYAEGGDGFTDGFAWIEPCSGEPLNLHYSTPPTAWQPLPASPSTEEVT